MATSLASRATNLKAYTNTQMCRTAGRGPLGEHNVRGPAVALEDHAARGRPKSSRGGQGSRARRLEKYQEAVAACAARWWPLVHGTLRQHRANLREAARVTWACTTSARAKLRGILWGAWVRRSMKIAGPHNLLRFDELCPIRGKLLEPLSRRDMWVLKRAAALALHVPELTHFEPDPDFDRRTRRHVKDWLHMRCGLVWAASWEVACSHRRHTHYAAYDIDGDSDDSDD